MSVSEFSDAGDTLVEMDRRRKERRLDDQGTEPKEDLTKEESTTDEPRAEGTPRKRKQRRRQIDPTTCEREYNNEEIAFMHAIDEYKRQSGRMFPTCSEILEVIRAMGYVRLNEAPQPAISEDATSESTPSA